MPKYRFRWTEIDYLEAVIEADDADAADAIFTGMTKVDSVVVDTEFGDGPYVEELDA